MSPVYYLRILRFIFALLICALIAKMYINSKDKSFMLDSIYFDESSRYVNRFWNLFVESNHPNRTANKLASLQPIYNNSVDNLWRPSWDVLHAVKINDRIIPQTIWQMEATKSNLLKEIVKPKKILLLDGFDWWQKPLWLKTNPRHLEASDCMSTPDSITSCTFTQNMYEKYDAVISAGDSSHVEEVDVINTTIVVYYTLESPFHSWAGLTRDNDLLASYWRGSDIVTPYDKWIYYDPLVKSKLQDKDYSLGKSIPVAIFVSNCNDWNDRMAYVRNLQEYIHVDIYGACGSPVAPTCRRAEGKKCFEMLQKDYYFYLSFENSNCRDYITEKFFLNGLKNDIIPVVLGAHPEDYAALAPRKSFIHVEDFDSPKNLAQYLNFLIKNPASYNQYFEWKGTGEFISNNFLCRICAMVHYADVVPLPRRLEQFDWDQILAVRDGMCLDKGEWYWTKENHKHTRKHFFTLDSTKSNITMGMVT